MNNVQKYTRTQIWWNTFKTQFYSRYKGTTRVVFQVTFQLHANMAIPNSQRILYKSDLQAYIFKLQGNI